MAGTAFCRDFFSSGACYPTSSPTGGSAALRDVAALFLRCCRPPAATTTASTHWLRTTTAVLSHPLAYFNYQTVLIMDPLSRSPAKRSKTAEVVENITCERNLFPETHICKLCVIPRSRVLRSVHFFRWSSTISGGLHTKHELATYYSMESTANSWHYINACTTGNPFYFLQIYLKLVQGAIQGP